jgi:hypothetical protein
MDKKEYFLTNSAMLSGIKVTKGDILRENATNMTVKVLNVYSNQEGHRMLMVEYNAPNRAGIPFQKGVDAFSFLS